jgi:hypothetical protein
MAVSERHGSDTAVYMARVKAGYSHPGRYVLLNSSSLNHLLKDCQVSGNLGIGMQSEVEMAFAQ